MAGLENVAGKVAIEAGKKLIEESDGLIRSLFGNSITEYGEIMTDNIRYRRLKNQISILEKVKDFIDEHNMELKQVNLKVMFPLLNHSSLEENEDLQLKWAKLIKNILTVKIEEVVQQKAVEVLSKMSNADARVMDHMYSQFIKAYFHGGLESMSIGIENISHWAKLETEYAKTVTSNLVSLGMLKNTIKGTGTGQASGASVSVQSIKVDDESEFRLTKIGFEIMKLLNE